MRRESHDLYVLVPRGVMELIEPELIFGPGAVGSNGAW
jgi:hypothetical protein